MERVEVTHITKQDMNEWTNEWDHFSEVVLRVEGDEFRSWDWRLQKASLWKSNLADDPANSLMMIPENSPLVNKQSFDASQQQSSYFPRVYFRISHWKLFHS